MSFNVISEIKVGGGIILVTGTADSDCTFSAKVHRIPVANGYEVPAFFENGGNVSTLVIMNSDREVYRYEDGKFPDVDTIDEWESVANDIAYELALRY